MNLTAIKNVVTSKASLQILTVQKNSPRLLFATGIVGVVGTVVLASRATLKLDEVLTEHNKTMLKVNTFINDEYTEEDRNKDKIVLYVQTAMKITKLYGPAIIIGAAAISCLAGSHHIMAQRNAGLTAAYVALEKGFNKYRARVIGDLGEDKDREYRYGSEEREVVKETDKGTVVTRERGVSTDGDPSGYAKFFGRDTSSSWSETTDYNIVFLRCQQNYMNDLLRARGHVLLNDVYDALGLDRTEAGCVVGWVLGSGGDDYISFGIFDNEMEPKHLDFFTGRENSVLLDFNVDGLVYNKI